MNKEREAWDTFWNHSDAKGLTLMVTLNGITYEYTRDDFEKAREVFVITGAEEPKE